MASWLPTTGLLRRDIFVAAREYGGRDARDRVLIKVALKGVLPGMRRAPQRQIRDQERLRHGIRVGAQIFHHCGTLL